MALLVMMLILFLAGSSFLLAQANQRSGRMERDAKTMAVLMQAREALIARAVTDNIRPGSLPCPAPDSEIGTAPSAFLTGGFCPQSAGWLPWRTLDLPDLRDGSGERLWYVIDQNLRDDDSAQPLNSNVTTTLTLNGAGGIAALVIAPGAPLGAQARPGNGIGNYLDGSNADGDSAFVSGPVGDAFNDHVIALDTTLLFSATARRILGEILTMVTAAGGAVPDASPNGTFPCELYVAPGWMTTNQWCGWVTYNRDTRTITLSGQTVTLP